ncbi:hypothetical protein DPMN_018987 [Dreissena polymorpha]|uniref:Uncharacterized protein n=1 Tax=Dreissena polymorpha TaxID=45954 RepID=A0A9D4NE75_DREPO|nr:hypothetical protein DPMN_018987 [Dreissena polymorpha]
MNDVSLNAVFMQIRSYDTKTQFCFTDRFGLEDWPPTFVSGIPGTSPSISDSTVIATSLGVFTVTDPDTT